MEPEYCIGCTDELIPALDDDPNGEKNATCVRCLAEESWDFDRYPKAKFNRAGYLIEPRRRSASPLKALKFAKDAGLCDVFGDGQRWQSQDGPSVDIADLNKIVAQAVLAERERCAVICDALQEKGPGNWKHGTPQDCAIAIRNQPPL